MAIQNRRGSYDSFNPGKAVPGEFLVVQSGDPNTTDGKAVYITFASGDVKLLATKSDVGSMINGFAEDIAQQLEDTVKPYAERAEAAAQSLKVDNTLTKSGQPADAKKVGDGLAEIDSKIGEVQNEIIRTAGAVEEMECGLTEEVKTALLACFEQVAWVGADGQTYYDALETALNKTRTIISINAVFAQGSAVVYDTDELYSLKQYLTVTAIYSDGSTREVSNYTLDGTLTAGTSAITVGYNKKTTTFNVTVTHQTKTLESISATFNSSASITTDNVLDDLRPYLTVRASYSDGSTNTITNYVLSGNLNVGTNTITVTYNNKTVTFTVNVTQAEKTLQSISAVFNQGSAVIYTDSSLNDLKPYLTVTARYSDSTTQNVTNYTLSGTLTKGTSTITASYGGKTATFNVVVTERITPSDVLYSLPSATTFNGTNTYVDTGLQLMKSEKSNITIVLDAIDNHPVGQIAVILHCMHENDPYPGVCIQEWYDSGILYAFDVNSNTASGNIRFPSGFKNTGVRVKAVMIIDFTSKTSKVIANIGGTDYTESAQLPSDVNDVDISENALLGCYQNTSGTKGRYWKGTVYDFKIYNRKFTDSEAQLYLQEDHS